MNGRLLRKYPITLTWVFAISLATLVLQIVEMVRDAFR